MMTSLLPSNNSDHHDDLAQTRGTANQDEYDDS